MYEVIFSFTYIGTDASYISLTWYFSLLRLVKVQSLTISVLWAVGEQTPIGTAKRNAKLKTVQSLLRRLGLQLFFFFQKVFVHFCMPQPTCGN